MTREEAIEELERLLRHWDDLENGKRCFWGYDKEAVALALTALRPITREQVENVWKGKWEPGNPICPICGKDKFDGLDADIWADWMPNFCPHCGAPMTDKALEITMKRMEELRND